jgi:hypothetical protein
MCTFDPIVHPSPTTEFKILVLLPILVPNPITENGPTTADCDCEISERGDRICQNIVHQIIGNKKIGKISSDPAIHKGPDTIIT